MLTSTERSRRWRLNSENKEHEKALARARYQKNKQKELFRKKKWREENKDRERFIVYKSSCKQKNRIFLLTKEDFKILNSSKCFYCGTEEKLGFDRLNPAVGYTISNVVPCCFRCNISKHTMTIEEFKQHISTIYNYWVLERK